MNVSPPRSDQLSLTDDVAEAGTLEPDDPAPVHQQSGLTDALASEVTEGLAEPEGTAVRDPREAPPTSEVLSQTKAALRVLRRARQQRAQQEQAARERLDRARAEFDAVRGRACAVEGLAWKALLDVPGMTVRTAASLGGSSVATVNRRLKEARDV